MKQLRMLTVLLAMMFFACGDETTPDTADATVDAGGGTDSGSDTSSSSEWHGAMYRTTEVLVTYPTTVGGILNNIINPEIRDDRLHILIETSDFAADSGATTFMLLGGAGDANGDGTYAFKPDTEDPVVASVDAAGNFANDAPILLPFPVLFHLDPVCDGDPCPDNHCRTNDDCRDTFRCDLEDTGECHKDIILPLHDVLIEGTFEVEDDMQILRSADLAGAILKAEADTIEVDLGGSIVILTTLLGENRMDYPEGSDEPTGWALSAKLNADEVNIENTNMD